MDSIESGCKDRLRMDSTEKPDKSTTSKKPAPIRTNITISGVSESLKSATLTTPSTPRIELSRASSSSHHEDSRDSSPDNVFEQDTIGVGFHEEGALELRSSTEELFFMDPEAKKEEQEKLQQQIQQARRSSPIIFKFDEHQNYLQHHQRKDSASSEVAALLCISGRTSRVSSVGSQGSAVSRLSAISGVSRSPSPHRMLLETSFCGPKPLENLVDGSSVSVVEAPTAEILEQVLLSRKHDPTQAVFAEGIKIESSPQKKKPPTSITNGDTKRKPTDVKRASRQTTSSSSKAVSSRAANRLTANKSPGQLVMGKTPSGSEYIRINLKPDHMYKDKGVAPNERVVEVAVPGAEKTGHHKKPISLSLGRNAAIDEKRLTPSLSPKPSRHSALSKEAMGSRSPSPANVSVSRKSSFCSLFKLKDSPDSPKDRVRSRSKSRDRSTPQSQNPTPNKQKSVLAIFKPKRGEGKSKSSSPIDFDFERHTPTASKDSAMETFQSAGSRPSSRLRYYDKPADGKGIHIPLHTPPEEKNVNKLLQESADTRPQSAPTLKESLASSHSISSTAKTKPNDVSSKPTPATIKPDELKHENTVLAAPSAPPVPHQNKVTKIQCIENLDAIHTLPQDVDEKEQTWSLEVHQHSSQDSQDTILSDNSLPNNCISKLSGPRTNLENVSEHTIDENGIAAEVHRVPSETESIPVQAQQQVEESMGREKRRILFATRLGSGSQEQMFSTQFSLSKTESLSSQLSEQASIPENSVQEVLQRKDTILRRPDDSTVVANKTTTPINRSEILKKPSVSKSQSTSEDEKQAPIPAAGILMRKKESMNEELRRKSSRSASEDDDVVATHRHSRYLENFDVRRKLHENVAARKSTSPVAIPQTKEEDVKMTVQDQGVIDISRHPQPKLLKKQISESETDTNAAQTDLSKFETFSEPIHIPTERQSFVSTDEPESSESERDSESDPHQLKRNLSRHIASAIEDHESTGLVSQESFDDELPYIPTTLPEERAHGVALIPMKERLHMELKTCPLDRPRSTTPLNPSHLEEYCGIVAAAPEAGGDLDHRQPIRGEKLRISLPKKDSAKDKAQKSKSPRRTSTSSGKSWFEFAEEAIRGPTTTTVTENNKLASIPKLPAAEECQPTPETPTSQAQVIQGNIRKLSDQWVDFQNIPEKRKTPKKITTLPKDTLADNKTMVEHYNYVKPEECQCECHDVERESVLTHKSIASVDLLNPTREDMQPLLEPETLESIDPSDSSREYSCYTDDETEGARTNQMQTEEFPLRGLHNSRNTKFPDNRYS
ncbi:uncharacterized protein LOC129918089 isoform X2 [Episyrphus balteatus]|uniref:uncharacterized protein LOC129918089 isoform X2 n=1 Tax=Episyrphus balteatus TaxID=286459 RepID=UPI002484D9D7|nr:uncharacterized protein LOC129918089 isoform X2 [Episyrphus balteatus]